MSPSSESENVQTLKLLALLNSSPSISFFGMLANWLVATTTLRLPSMRNSFGRLLTSQSIGDGILCSVFLFIYSPMVFFDLDALKELAPHSGSILLICYNICLFSHFFISINRLCAICWPFRFEKFFSERNTTIFIITLWVASVAFVLYVIDQIRIATEGQHKYASRLFI
ncbi:unnamed protein product [Heligmosomoides polygyrus]|uniref:G_PROTEIN_RECEP_F1_2 domain-containing protein n=1 Tax=Heligmosomoides polygyrus TaxID=6339 RepID=A0A3P7ZSC2_HELPZ|nr:unnamed protein product [Heligmosomoides polygyrus]